MCGRYTIYHDASVLGPLFGLDDFPARQRFNIAPSQTVPVVVESGTGRREALDARWGLIPAWVGDPRSLRTLLFNARIETAAEKPAFRDAMRRGRCLVPASGFYEWSRGPQGKQPYLVRRADGEPLALAGLWSRWRRGAEELVSCAILTTAATGVVRELHERMPVPLPAESFGAWLEPAPLPAAELAELTALAGETELELLPVDPAVGRADFDGPELLRGVPGVAAPSG